ncbi:MAG: hypothetical protein QMD77_02410, partial [Patescibacteria group bacterium]|nr:hypothetical protein [Patescibacteria group bacterium]
LVICFSVFVLSRNNSLAATEITSDIISETTWDETGSPYLVYKKIYINAPLMIKPGVIVKFQYYGTGSAGQLVIKNELNAVGTSEKKIIFTSMRDDEIGGDTNGDGTATRPARGDWYGLAISDNSYNSRIEHAKILYAEKGIAYTNYSGSNFRGLVLRNSEIRFCNEGLKVFSTVPIVENNVIEENKTGIVAYSDPAKGRIPTFRNNSIAQNTMTGLDGRDVYGSKSINIDARHNWWGDASGPKPTGGGNQVMGDGIVFNPWLDESPQAMPRKPVILVPGIGASVNWDLMLGGVFPENWTLMSHTYDGIIQALKEMGYEEGKNLFVCYYDWRNNNAISAENYLKPVIDKALSESGAFSANIVAHSMGGLVARGYIQSDGYKTRNDIENLVMIGTPNKGSSDVYPVWEGGRIPKNWETRLVFSAYINYLRAKNFTYSPYQIVHDLIPSVKELMPVYNYIHPKDNPDFLKNYNTDMQEKNSWLIGLNSGIYRLNARTKVISVSGNGQATVNKIPIIGADESPLWIDGKPEPIDPVRDDTAGDKRVLLSSSQIQSYFSKALDFDHGDIVDQSETLIADLLGENLSEIYPSPEIRDELAFWFASPVDVEIEDPDGKAISKDANSISNNLAQYSGESKPDGFKFISVPNPVEGDYKIKLTGNGDGDFRAGSIYVHYENDIPDQESAIEGTIGTDEVEKYKIEYNPENTEDPIGGIVPFDTTPPIITITSPEEKDYTNDGILNIDYSVEDAESGVASDEWRVEKDGQKFDWPKENVDLSLEHLGDYIFKVSATDEAGNSVDKKAEFRITTDINAIRNNLTHYFDLGLVKKKIAYRYFSRKFENLEKLFNFLEKTKNSRLKPKPKQAAVEALEKIINANIDRLIRQINRKSPRWIDPKAAEFLIEDLNNFKI